MINKKSLRQHTSPLSARSTIVSQPAPGPSYSEVVSGEETENDWLNVKLL